MTTSPSNESDKGTPGVGIFLVAPKAVLSFVGTRVGLPDPCSVSWTGPSGAWTSDSVSSAFTPPPGPIVPMLNPPIAPLPSTTISTKHLPGMIVALPDASVVNLTASASTENASSSKVPAKPIEFVPLAPKPDTLDQPKVLVRDQTNEANNHKENNRKEETRAKMDDLTSNNPLMNLAGAAAGSDGLAVSPEKEEKNGREKRLRKRASRANSRRKELTSQVDESNIVRGKRRRR